MTGTGFFYSQWRSETVNRLQNGSDVILTARGPMEYQLVGQGSAALILHGTLGGYDQAFVTAHMINSPSIQFLAISRPGYLHSPLSTGASLEDQAEAYVALLDALQIEKVAVIATSGGGPYALQFALRHPERCWALVLISANTEPTIGYATALSTRAAPPPDFITRLVMSDFVSWIGIGVVKWQPAFILERMIGQEEARVALNDPFRKQLFDEFVDSLALLGQRREGSVNDAVQFMAAAHAPWGNIRVPTLVLHGEADLGVPMAQAEYIARIIPNAQFMRVPNGTHWMTMSHADTLGPAIRAFLYANDPNASTF
ncbi:MAG: alpha/beta hydrolase [Anaerolineae bacterium]|nr:alpha/beta hydrolase [Anaerolineae bacterium]